MQYGPMERSDPRSVTKVRISLLVSHLDSTLLNVIPVRRFTKPRRLGLFWAIARARPSQYPSKTSPPQSIRATDLSPTTCHSRCESTMPRTPPWLMQGCLCCVAAQRSRVSHWSAKPGYMRARYHFVYTCRLCTDVESPTCTSSSGLCVWDQGLHTLVPLVAAQLVGVKV